MNENNTKIKKLIRYFFQGLLYIAPLGITIYVVFIIFNFIDGILRDTLENFKIYVPGLGFIILITLLTILGYIGQTIIAQPFKLIFERFMQKAPIVRVIYSSLNDFLSAFVGKEKKFNKPVIVTINPSHNIKKIGFITQEDLADLGEKDMVAVYFPHSYNFSGELFIVPKEHVRTLSISAAEAMKFAVSGGVTKMLNDPNLGH